nr:MAG TPA: hypothetical protein [Caudoviricetes sp.]
MRILYHLRDSRTRQKVCSTVIFIPTLSPKRKKE